MTYEWTLGLMDGTRRCPKAKYMTEVEGMYVFHNKKRLRQITFEIRKDAVMSIQWPARGE